MSKMRGQQRLLIVLFSGLITLLMVACQTASFSFKTGDRANITFEVCAQSEKWQRPSEAKQKAKWLDNGRYLGVDEAVLRGPDSPWKRKVFLDYGNSVYDQLNLSGLWTATEEQEDIFDACYEKERQRALISGQTIRVWLLFAQVQSIVREGREYEVMVTPTETGFQWVDIPRPDSTEDLTFRLMMNDGKPLETLVETGFNNWRYQDSQLTY